jgi:hypothetical protein
MMLSNKIFEFSFTQVAITDFRVRPLGSLSLLYVLYPSDKEYLIRTYKL